MILCDKDLKKLLGFTKNVEPCSVDLTLGNEFLRLATPEDTAPYGEGGDSYCYDLQDAPQYYPSSGRLNPLSFLLATTAEVVKVPKDMAAIVVGKSTIARKGVQIECAGLVDPGFEGQITLEIFNQSPNSYVLIPGMKIAQILFFKLTDECENAYQGKYQGQKGVTPARKDI